MAVSRKHMIEALQSIQEPRLVPEGDFQGDGLMRVISSEGGYCIEVDEVYIDGPFFISENDNDDDLDFSEDRDELETILIGDVMDMAECQTWEDMSTPELEEWHEWMDASV